MNEDEKRRFDAIAQLYQRSWDQFNARRQFEFRVALAYWATLAAASAGSVQLESFPQIPGGKLLIVGFAIATTVLHIFWMWGIWRGQGTDQMVAIHYQAQLQKLSQTEFPPALSAIISDRSRHMGRLRHPTAVFEVGLTALLALAFVVINWSRM